MRLTVRSCCEWMGDWYVIERAEDVECGRATLTPADWKTLYDAVKAAGTLYLCAWTIRRRDA